MMLHPDVERLALLGWRLHPASQRNRKACIQNAAELATYDLDQLLRWAREFPRCNWRIIMQGSGIWALDCDVPPGHAHDGIANLGALTKVHGPIPPRPQLRSGGGGLALFFRHDGEAIIGESGHPAPGIDPRRGRQSQTIPPSIHPDTRQPYRWIVPPWELHPPPAPGWLLRLVAPPPAPEMPNVPRARRGRPDKLQNYAVAALHHAAKRVASAQQGSRNDTLNREAYGMLRFTADGTLTPSEIADALAYAARLAGLDPPQIKGTLTSALRARMR